MIRLMAPPTGGRRRLFTQTRRITALRWPPADWSVHTVPYGDRPPMADAFGRTADPMVHDGPNALADLRLPQGHREKGQRGLPDNPQYVKGHQGDIHDQPIGDEFAGR